MDASNLVDNPRLEVVGDGLPLIAGTQLAVNTTLVCSLHGDGTPHRKGRCKRRKERTYPERLMHGSRAKLVVFALAT